MTHRRIPAVLATAALAFVAAPALAETVYIETVPAERVYVPPATYYYYTEPVPATTVTYTEPPIIVTAPTPTDARINQDVVDTLAADPRLSGRIGVETRDREVELSGVTTTEGQALHAERDAKSVYGVRNVRNEITSRMGPHTR